MKKQNGNKLMQKWKNKAGVRLSALDKKKLVLTNLPYILTAFMRTGLPAYTEAAQVKIWEINCCMRWNMLTGSLQGFC